MTETYDLAIIGGGIAGFSTALRLQTKGLKTIVLESHGQLGGCAGFFTKKGFAFDVGATTLVDFVKGGVGGNFFDEINLDLPKGEYIDYVAWLPDRQITLYRDRNKWNAERLAKIGATKNYVAFWALMDRVTDVFWQASRQNIKLPIQSWSDVRLAMQTIGFKNIYLVKYLNYTMLDVLKQFKLDQDKTLKGLLSMLIEDTVHSSLDKAPFINAALGTTIRGAGLMRAEGGMKKFWQYLSAQYVAIGGTIKVGHKVQKMERLAETWHITTTKGLFKARKVISSLPIDLTCIIVPKDIQRKLEKYLRRNAQSSGGAIVVFLGVKDADVSNQALNHHQILQDYDAVLGNGNNLFISVSAQNDLYSAPVGCRSVMISTHCNLAEWQNLTEQEYYIRKKEIGNKLLTLARTVYPNLATEPIVYEIGTPRTYQKFTHRINGSVGGFKQTLKNANLRAIPQHIGEKDFWIVGDHTWPGLGTVAGLISSKIVSEYAVK